MRLSCFEMDHGSSNSLNAGAYSGPSAPPPPLDRQNVVLKVDFSLNNNNIFISTL